MTETLASSPRSRLAVVALIMAILIPIAGAVLGHITLRQISQTRETGRGMAIAATIIGWVGTVAWFVFWAFFLTALSGAVS